MLHEHIEKQILEHFPFAPTEDQERLIAMLGRFIADPGSSLFILNGYAGTGKTTVIASLVNTLSALRARPVLLAPTGRAAKVMGGYADRKAYTIHKKIYRQKGALIDRFELDINRHRNAFFIIDEASMLSNGSSYENSIFGSGRLLDDLFTYVSSGAGCKVIIVGDNAQLPPVGSTLSPALDKFYMAGFADVTFCSMDQVVRQEQESGILFNATLLRRIIESGIPEIPRFRLGFPDFERIGGGDFLELLEDAYRKYGERNTLVICRSNKQANRFNQGIRGRVLYREEELENGDMVMIVKNNYFYAVQEEPEEAAAEQQGEKEEDFIANGDVAVIKRIKRYEELYGFRFADVTLAFPDNDDAEIDCKVILDTLDSTSPSLSYEENQKLFAGVEEDYAHITVKKKRYAEMKQNPYLNALQIKFAYAVTCHKAQGGQWDAVFVDNMLWGTEEISTDLLRWLYTAVTRAREKVYMLNFRDDFFEEA